MPTRKPKRKAAVGPKLPKGPTWDYKERQIRAAILHLELARKILGKALMTPPGGGPNPKDDPMKNLKGV